MVLRLLAANLVHGLVAVAWVAGLSRVAGPLSALSRARLWQLCLTMPPFIAVLRLCGAPTLPEHLSTLRVGRWTALLQASGRPGIILAGGLLGGTALLFLLQELWPLWRARRGLLHAPERSDARLDAALGRVRAAYAQAGLPVHAHMACACLCTDVPVAAVQGLVTPRFVVSEGLLAQLDDPELDGALAHEMAHVVYGGNRTPLLLWLLRALQAVNPSSLLAFRVVYEVRESACDALAAHVTGKPEVLASALLKARRQWGAVTERESRVSRAREEVLRRADSTATRLRVRALLDGDVGLAAPMPWTLLAAVVLGGLLWTVG